MKKLNYLMMPLLVVPFLAACNGGNEGCPVTKEEWDAAVVNKGETFLQLVMKRTDESGEVVMSLECKSSPTACSVIADNLFFNDKSNRAEFYTSKTTKDGKDYYVNKMKQEDGSWKVDYEGGDVKQTMFMSPQDAALKNTYQNLPSYDEFKYDESTKTYVWIDEEEANEGDSKVVIKFVNKKVSTVWTGDKDSEDKEKDAMTMTYTYNSETPADPSK